MMLCDVGNIVGIYESPELDKTSADLGASYLRSSFVEPGDGSVGVAVTLARKLTGNRLSVSPSRDQTKSCIKPL